MSAIILSKYHALGNDYLVLDPNKNSPPLCTGADMAEDTAKPRSLGSSLCTGMPDGDRPCPLLQPEVIRRLCHRHFGAGADGLLYGPIPTKGAISLRMFNPDGSEAEESGNGVRIFAKYLLEEGYVTAQSFSLHTLGGLIEIEFLSQEDGRMRIHMGKPVYAGNKIPLSGLEGEVVNAHLRFHDNDYNTTCLSIGNPNCVIMMEEITPQKAKSLGPYVEGAAYFPNRINMQLCKVIDRQNLAIEIYERGAGYTLASGTGACAAAAAAHRMGLVDGEVTVHMPGGSLLIEISEDGAIHMTGAVKKVGTFLLAEDFL